MQNHLEQLRQTFPHKFPVYYVLLQNANLSYELFPDSSVSLPERKDVQRFGKFIKPYLRDRVLDVGIGPMPLPGYFSNPKGFELIGLDPITLPWSHVLEACAEFMPFENDYFSAVVFATSLDHVCDTARSISESYRVLKPDGSVLVWMSDNSHLPPQHGIVEIQGIPFVVPPGAIDPFHMRNESYERTIGKFNFAGFELKQLNDSPKSEIFMRFGKK